MISCLLELCVMKSVCLFRETCAIDFDNESTHYLDLKNHNGLITINFIHCFPRKFQQTPVSFWMTRRFFWRKLCFVNAVNIVCPLLVLHFLSFKISQSLHCVHTCRNSVWSNALYRTYHRRVFNIHMQEDAKLGAIEKKSARGPSHVCAFICIYV